MALRRAAYSESELRIRQSWGLATLAAGSNLRHNWIVPVLIGGAGCPNSRTNSRLGPARRPASSDLIANAFDAYGRRAASSR